MYMLWVLAAAAVGFLFLFWLSPIGVPALKRLGNGKPSPDLTFGYTAADTYGLLTIYGQPGIDHWRRLLLLDMVFPAVYGALLALLASKWALWAGAGPAWRAMAVSSPIVSAAADYVENVLLLRVIASPQKRMPVTVTTASAFTRLKFLFFIATLLTPLAYWGSELVAGA